VVGNDAAAVGAAVTVGGKDVALLQAVAMQTSRTHARRVGGRQRTGIIANLLSPGGSGVSHAIKWTLD
jgi:hypothetical protein